MSDAAEASDVRRPSPVGGSGNGANRNSLQGSFHKAHVGRPTNKHTTNQHTTKKKSITIDANNSVTQNEQDATKQRLENHLDGFNRNTGWRSLPKQSTLTIPTWEAGTKETQIKTGNRSRQIVHTECTGSKGEKPLGKPTKIQRVIQETKDHRNQL